MIRLILILIAIVIGVVSYLAHLGQKSVDPEDKTDGFWVKIGKDASDGYRKFEKGVNKILDYWQV